MIYLLLLFFLFSCSTPSYQKAALHFEENAYEEAEKDLVEADLPFTQSKNSILLLLSRALVYFKTGKMEACLKDTQKALDAIDYYKQSSTAELIGQTILQDDLGAYVPPLYEESLARFYQALAFLHLEDEDNAAATLMYLENHTGQINLTTYLLSLLLSRRGDESNARILASRLNTHIPKGNVLIIHHRGLAPYKVSTIAPVSIVSAALLETILGIADVRPALSTLVGVPVPELICRLPPSLTIPLKPSLSYDVTLAAGEALDKDMPIIATRAAARLLLRRGLIASTKEDLQPLMDLAMLVSNAVTKADTRSLRILPSQIDLYNLHLQPGNHSLKIGSQTLNLTIDSKELTIIEIFHPRKNHEEIYSNCPHTRSR